MGFLVGFRARRRQSRWLVGNVKGAAAEVRKAVKLLDVLDTGYLRVGAPHVASAGRGLGV